MESGTPIKACLTFDLDFTDYLADGSVFDLDELEKAFPIILKAFSRYPECRATWFVRLDPHMAALWGTADIAFQKYATPLNWLKNTGHEIGWHFHSYRQHNGKWAHQESILPFEEEIKAYAPVAKALNLRIARIGWGCCSNSILQTLIDNNFSVDSSAIPRPKYGWDPSLVDWSKTPQKPYRPSAVDFRIGGEQELPITEVPISCPHIPAPYDTQKVMRYLNLAYQPPIFRKALAVWFETHSFVNIITHPYELMPNSKKHPLLAFNKNALEANIQAIKNLSAKNGSAIEFLTLSEVAEINGDP